MKRELAKIEIDEKNKGKFTSYCKGKGFNSVTEGCLAEGLDSPNKLTRKRAQFAKNARSWDKGGRKLTEFM